MANLLIILKKRSKIVKLFLAINLFFFLLVSCNKNESEFENALNEFEKYRIKQDKDYISDFDKEVKKITIPNKKKD